MSHTPTKSKARQQPPKRLYASAPIPVRFTVEDEALLRQLYALSGLSMSQIIRRSVHYMVPRFLDGRINLLTLQEESKHPVRLEHPGLQEQQLKPRL